MLKTFIIFITFLINTQLSFGNFIAINSIDAIGLYQERAVTEETTGINIKKANQEGITKKAFSYNGGEKATGGNGIKTTNINTAKTDLTDSGEVINKLYHETTNFEGHKENEVVAKRRGDYAQKVWEYNNAANGNVNTNTRTSADWNKEYKVLNNKTLAVGTVKSSILYHQDRENNNNYLEAGLEAASLTMGSVSLYKNLRNSKYKDAVIDAGGLILDTIGVLFPIVPGVASAGIQASRQGDGIINFIKGKVGKKKAERAEWQKTDIMDLTDSAEDIAKKHSIEKKAFQKKYKNNGGSGSSGNSPNSNLISKNKNFSSESKSIQDQMTLDHIKKNPNVGKSLDIKLKDPKFQRMIKYQFKIKSNNGKDTVIHYIKDPKTEKFLDFKFNKHSNQ